MDLWYIEGVPEWGDGRSDKHTTTFGGFVRLPPGSAPDAEALARICPDGWRTILVMKNFGDERGPYAYTARRAAERKESASMIRMFREQEDRVLVAMAKLGGEGSRAAISGWAGMSPRLGDDVLLRLHAAGRIRVKLVTIRHRRGHMTVCGYGLPEYSLGNRTPSQLARASTR